MQFGIFDHLDRNKLPLKDYYEARLQLIETYDREGFYAYHVAEHHSTPLGMAPSPSVFLSAVAQRTKRLRFGPLVYALPLYHPIRLIEEICMLDQMSGGRLDIGFGRGASQIEAAIYGNDPAKAEAMYVEGLELIMRGLTHKTLDFHGECFSFDDVPMELEPLQKPHPPVWYGVHSVVSAERAARQGLNIVSLDPADKTRDIHRSLSRSLARSAGEKSYRAADRSRPLHLRRGDGRGSAHDRPQGLSRLASELQLSFLPPRRQGTGASTAGGVGRAHQSRPGYRGQSGDRYRLFARSNGSSGLQLFGRTIRFRRSVAERD